MSPTEQQEPAVAGFELFVDEARPRLRKALVARYGPELGVEATAEAIAYAWQHWQRVGQMDNAIGYLYRVAQTAVRQHHRWGRPLARLTMSSPDRSQPDIADGPFSGSDPELHTSLAALSDDQRVAVVLVHGYAWGYQEVADLLGVPVSTVRNHVHRGLNRLRTTLEER